jgi:hypothetical protein
MTVLGTQVIRKSESLNNAVSTARYFKHKMKLGDGYAQYIEKDA